MKVRYEISKYSEVKVLKTVNFIIIKRFLEKCIFYKHGTLIKLKVNGSLKNKNKV